MVEAIRGANVVDNFPERKFVGHVRDTCVVAIEEASSPVKPHRALPDKVVHGLIVHGTVRTYLRYALWFVLVKVIVQLAVTSKVLRGCPKFVFAKTGEGFGVGVSPYRTEVYGGMSFSLALIFR